MLGGIVLSFIEAMQTVKRTNALALIQQTVGLLEARTATSQDILRFRASPPNVINCRNGELWISQEGSVSLQPHRPESYLTHCIETEYDPEATSPMYDRAVAEIFSKAEDPASLVTAWHEIGGYAM